MQCPRLQQSETSLLSTPRSHSPHRNHYETWIQIDGPLLTFGTSFLLGACGVWSIFRGCPIYGAMWITQMVTSLFFHGWLLLYDRNYIVWRDTSRGTRTFKVIRAIDMFVVHTEIPFAIACAVSASWFWAAAMGCGILQAVLFIGVFPRYKKGNGYTQHAVLHINGVIGMYFTVQACALTQCILCPDPWPNSSLSG
jgi:hypothetical protein